MKGEVSHGGPDDSRSGPEVLDKLWARPDEDEDDDDDEGCRRSGVGRAWDLGDPFGSGAAP